MRLSGASVTRGYQERGGVTRPRTRSGPQAAEGGRCALRTAITSGEGSEALGGAGGTRTHDRRIMSSTAPCTERASCTDDTGHLTRSTGYAGIIRRVVPRTVPRRHLSRPAIVLLCVTSPKAPRPHRRVDPAGVGRRLFSVPSQHRCIASWRPCVQTATEIVHRTSAGQDFLLGRDSTRPRSDAR